MYVCFAQNNNFISFFYIEFIEFFVLIIFQNDADISTNLIELDASTSFELDDFDPLNQNAKKIPAFMNPPPASVVLTQMLSTSPGTSQSNSQHAQAFSNPVYPYYLPQHTNPQQLTENATKQDEEIELLRKYGLDRFKLVDTNRSSLTNNLKSNELLSMGNHKTNDQLLLSSNGKANPHLSTNNYLKTNGDYKSQNQQRKNTQWTTFE